MKISTQMKTKWMQFKVSALSASVTALIVSSIPTQISASDIDIYQAGGTGGVNIYFMLDVSNSMKEDGLPIDYGYSKTECSVETKYTQVTSGGTYKAVSVVDRGNGRGTYNRSRSNSNYIYTYVGPNQGRYDVTFTVDSSSGGIKYKQDGTYNKCNDVTYCDSNTNIGTDLYVGSHKYASSTDKHCLIDLSGDWTSNTADQAYADKIKNICEKVPNKTTEYRCLQRISKLKKGLLELANDSRINETIYVAVGTYSGDISNGEAGATLSSYLSGGKTKFIALDNAGKTTFRNAILGITPASGTPTAGAFNKAAASHYNKTNSSSTGVVSEECTGNGVYLLTDGVPQGSNSPYPKLRDQGSKAPLFKQAGSLAAPTDFSYDYWKNLARSIYYARTDSKRIKTATVGFGGVYFNPISDTQNAKGEYQCDQFPLGTESGDIRALCYLGAKNYNYGKGGFYTAQSTSDLIESVFQFVDDVSVEIEGSTMGTNTIPVDALNPTQLQNYSYFPMFKPIVGGDEQLWAGNLKKFAVQTSTGTVVDKSSKPVFKDGKIQEKLSDYWYESAGSSDEDVYMAWGGLLSKLKVHHKPLLASSGSLDFQRNVYVDDGSDLKQAVTGVLNSNLSLNNKHYLWGLLGYSKLTQADFNALAGKSFTEQVNYLKTRSTVQDFQMGSVIHSTPIMLTQKGVFEEADGEYGVTGREDYILAGTTQGLVQVVDADTGKEVFSFLPSEFLTRTTNSQEKGFAESLAMDRFAIEDKDQFFYGVDGPWVAHTEYEYALEGDKEIMTAKKQYAYGGLRMGGRSYYALDLTDLGKTSSKPKLLFAIKPDNHISGALSYMGESWSKPVVTYIPWKGQKKLAMIVGGGYDRKYESQDVTGTVKGNGIYIFAAEDYDTNTKAGSLLWWGSSNATNSTSSTKIDTMTHSIPSRVKAVDRNGDGITDHLYVGDLGGQVFRVDFNSKLGVSAVNTPLVQQAVKIADLNSSGKYPRRFYEAPTFTIHKDNNGKRFAMVTLASGDRSSPLSTETNYPTDYIVAIKDDTVTQTTVTAPIVITLNSMLDISSTSTFNKGTHKGWFYPLPKSSSKQVRGIEEGIAIDNDLYYSVFNPDASTATEDGAEDCTGGVTGKSIAYKFCLPYGDKTCLGTSTSTNPEKIGELGAGIIGLTLGAGRSQATNRTLIFNKDIDPKPPEYAVSDKLVPKRWFEYLPFNSGGD